MAIMAGIEGRDEKLRALKANQMQADMLDAPSTLHDMGQYYYKDR